MESPTRTQTQIARSTVKKAWPLIERCLRELMNEQRLGNSKVHGRPFSKKAWVEEGGTGCFMVRKDAVFHNYDKEGSNTSMIRISVKVFPNYYALVRSPWGKDEEFHG